MPGKTPSEALTSVHGITFRDISARCGVQHLTVANVLRADRFHGVRYRELFRVRRAVEAALTEKGADPSRGKIWEEYDARVPEGPVADRAS